MTVVDWTTLLFILADPFGLEGATLLYTDALSDPSHLGDGSTLASGIRSF